MDAKVNLALKFKITEVPMKVKGVDSVFPDKNSSKPEKQMDGSVGFDFTYYKKDEFQRKSTYISESVRTGIIYIKTTIELISN